MGERGGGSSSIGLNWILMSLFFPFGKQNHQTLPFPSPRSIRRRRQREREGGGVQFNLGLVGDKGGVGWLHDGKEGVGIFPSLFAVGRSLRQSGDDGK